MLGDQDLLIGQVPSRRTEVMPKWQIRDHAAVHGQAGHEPIYHLFYRQSHRHLKQSAQGVLVPTQRGTPCSLDIIQLE